MKLCSCNTNTTGRDEPTMFRTDKEVIYNRIQTIPPVKIAYLLLLLAIFDENNFLATFRLKWVQRMEFRSRLILCYNFSLFRDSRFEKNDIETKKIKLNKHKQFLRSPSNFSHAGKKKSVEKKTKTRKKQQQTNYK